MQPIQQRLKASDFRVLDEVFKSRDGSGYVLDFTNQTFAQFFRDELGVNIDDHRYYAGGSSKGKRLVYFLRTAEPKTIHKTLVALWDYRVSVPGLHDDNPLDPKTENAFRRIVEKFGDSLPDGSAEPVSNSLSEPLISNETSDQLADQLIEISKMEPQARGYAFERFLKEVFDAHGMKGGKSFRLIGEQIDGSFEFAHETYLLEAKWQNDLTPAKDLRDFQGKIEAKAAWSRGLFVSNSGFTEEGLVSFGSGKRIICMDGLDLFEIFHRRRSFNEVMRLKLRKAAETGRPFVRVRDLFPNE